MPAPEIFEWVKPSVLARHPWIAFLLFFFATWFSQEGALLGSSFMWKQGKVDWWQVFWGNTLGMTSGDLLLYFIALKMSTGLEKPWLQRFIKPHHFERGRGFYQKWGNWLTFMARFIPGMHVPGYAAAGLMRAPFGPFATIVFLTAALYVGGFMTIARVLSPWQIFWLCLLALLLTQWVLTGFEDDNWKKRGLALKRLFRL